MVAVIVDQLRQALPRFLTPRLQALQPPNHGLYLAGLQVLGQAMNPGFRS
jgi:hypothetical protein